MATHIKKRALAEYTSQVVQQEPQVNKSVLSSEVMSMGKLLHKGAVTNEQ
jgi:hypothetical protein